MAESGNQIEDFSDKQTIPEGDSMILTFPTTTTDQKFDHNLATVTDIGL